MATYLTHLPTSRSRINELKILLILAVPILIAQLAQTSMGFVDTLMASQVGAEDLAAVSLGSSVWLPIMLSLGGILMATTPQVAQLAGASQEQKTKSVFDQAIIIALICTVIAILILRNSTPLLELMSITGTLQQKTDAYLKALSWGVPAIMIYQVCRSYCEGFGKTKPPMKIALFGLLCNIPLNYIFIYGKLGLPAFGGVGCGWATAIVMWIMLFCALVYFNSASQFKNSQLFKQLQPPSLNEIMAFLRLGLPIGFTLLVEVSMFCMIALLVARLGDTVIAAHQITLSVSGLVFMFPLSIAMALTIRVGQLVGSGANTQARFSATTGLYFTTTCAIGSCALLAVFAPQITAIYTDVSSINALAASLLLIAAIFQIPDAIQTASAGALRGYKDTTIPLCLVFIAFWLIALPIGYLLSLTNVLLPAIGAAGFWYSLVIGLTIGAILLVTRLHYISR